MSDGQTKFREHCNGTRDSLVVSRSYFLTTLQVSCAKCGNGLGHEFLGDGPKAGQSRF